ncbi:phytanoyl- dioxygenase family protein [Purpureocillium lavendulum]|uniref:Phytanoyl- dioxygenase family protein n=1 Tax=Purpureocillium lavendulum TaxID=1247861 RepID=A0AB34FWU0_9HYPO|nr:phytanoyl- dioxygenase family protein [Purpureocillium lavendulum]
MSTHDRTKMQQHLTNGKSPADINAEIAPPSRVFQDAFISYARLQDAYNTDWPPRHELEVPEFSAGADPPACDVVDALKRVGGCIVRNIVSRDAIAQMERDIRPALEADEPWSASSFFPPTTRRAFGLIGKSEAFALSIIGNDLYQRVCDDFLTTKSYPYYGNRDVLNVSPPQVNNTIAFSVRPGNSYNQPLHRDDDIHYADRPRVDKYPDQTNTREYGIGFFVAGTKTTKANGATRFIPGSHLECTLQPPDESFARYAELDPGDGFIMLSSCYHGGSANTTKDEERLVFSCFMTRGWLRQEENQYLAVPLEVAKRLPLRIQKLMGYATSEPMLGWVDFKDPLVVINPENAQRVAHKKGSEALT